MFTTWLTRTNLILLWSWMNQGQILILENDKGHFCHFLTNPIVEKSKADTKVIKSYDRNDTRKINQRLPGACNRSPGSKLLSITTQLHCGGHLGGRAWLPDTILEEDHPMTIPSKFGSNWATGSRQDGFYVNFP